MAERLLETDFGLHHKPKDCNPVLTNDTPRQVQRARAEGGQMEDLASFGTLKNRKPLSICLKCVAQPMEIINRSLLISNISELCLLKACIS